jgi:hypothetical protein
MIDDNMNDHVPLTTDESSFVSSRVVDNCHFAKIFPHLITETYSGKGARLSLTELQENVTRLNTLVCNWQQTAVAGVAGTDITLTSMPFEKKMNESTITLQYHELVLHICCRPFISNPPNPPNTDFLQDCQRTMVKSACSILEIGNSI